MVVSILFQYQPWSILIQISCETTNLY